VSRKGVRRVWAYAAMVAILLSVISGVFVAVPPQTASAATTYTVTRTPWVPAGTTWDATVQGTAFTTVIVRADAVQLMNGDQVDIVLPSDYQMTLRAVVPEFLSDDPGTANGINPGNVNLVRMGANRYNLSMEGLPLAGNASKAEIQLVVDRIVVPTGRREDIKMRFEAPGTSGFSSAEVIIGHVGTGVVSVSMEDIQNISSAGVQQLRYSLYVKEDVAGSMVDGADSVKIKLPTGFTWSLAGDNANIILRWGDALPAGGRLGVNLANPTDNDINLNLLDDRTLQISVGRAAVSTINGRYFEIRGLGINVDESVAKYGDVECTVSGRSSVRPGTLVVARYGEFAATAKAYAAAPNVRAGRYDEEIGKIEIAEALPESLIAGRTITLTLPGYAAWRYGANNNVIDGPTVSATDSDAQGITLNPWQRIDDQTIKCTVNTTSAGASKPGRLVLEKARIAVSPAAPEGALKITVGGTAGVTGEVVVANVVKTAKISVEGTVPEVAVGTQNIELPPIVIEETEAEGLDGGRATATDVAIANDPNDTTRRPFVANAYKVVRLEFLQDVLPSQPTKVEVVAGDIDVDPALVDRTPTADGRWGINIPIKGTSRTASKIKVSGVKLNVWSGYPAGAVTCYLKGSSVVQTVRWFPGYTALASAPVANIVAPAAREGAVAKSATFKIGSTIYNVGAEARAMDAAPYIKDNRTFVPVRYLAYALGVKESDVKWDAATQTVTLTKDKTTVKLVIGSNVLTVNDQVKYMDVAPEIVEPGRTMLPARWVAEAFGAAVGWDPATQTVLIQW